MKNIFNKANYRWFKVCFGILVLSGFLYGQNNPSPTLNTISPSSAEIGNDGMTVVFYGQNFVSTSVARFNGIDLSTNFVSESEMEVWVPATYFNNVGSYNVVVYSPEPGGGISSALQFEVTGTSQHLTSISPTSLLYGSTNYILQITGENFTQNSVVCFRGMDRPTEYINSTSLTATLSPGDLMEGGTFDVTVYNFSTGGGRTNPVSLTISYPEPVLNSLSSYSKSVGDPGFIMTINGTGFVPASRVMIDDNRIKALYVDPTMLQVEIPENYMRLPMEYSIAVSNPFPGGGLSSNLIFTIDGPKISTISPSKLKAGSLGFMMKIDGQNFTASTVGKFNGALRQTTFINSSMIYISILKDDIQTPGEYQISVSNMNNKSIESNQMVLTVIKPKDIYHQGGEVKEISSTNNDDILMVKNYPNPFNPITTISFSLPTASNVSLSVYSSVGQLVSTLIDNVWFDAGEQNIRFESSNIASGEYFYHLIVTDMNGQQYSTVRKMILIK